MASAFAQSSSTLSGSPSLAYSSSGWPQPTPNTQKVIYIEIFSISGIVLASSPWIIQLLVSSTIIFLYKTKYYDLTWLIRLPSEEGSCFQDSRVVDEGISNRVWVANGNAQGKYHNGLGMQLLADGRNGPRLQRSRTV
ncbi:hypothetical protein REPUB_Repub05bG0129800 [Reevesia pubescens]